MESQIMGTDLSNYHLRETESEKMFYNGDESETMSDKQYIYRTQNPDISNLVSNINKSLEKNNGKIEIKCDKEIEKKEDSWHSSIPIWLKEIALFLVIYLIMSMGTTKRTIGNYIDYINPDENGDVSFLGLLIYGLILIVIYMICKYLFIK